MAFQYRVLGPLELVSDGTPRTPPRQLRTLLAALLVDPRTPLTSDSLIEAIWSGRRAVDATPTLRRHIARARAELGVEIATTPVGYQLVVADDDIDGVKLVQTVRGARRSGGVDGLRAALGLWRSTPFPELADWAPGRLAAAALTEARIEGLELLVRADLDRAAPSAELLGELRSIVDEHPYREAFAVLLVLALYRSGRQQEALDAVSAARSKLAEDLGVLPGPELVAVERAVLEHAPDVRLPPAHSPMLPPRLRLTAAAAPLIGRSGALRTLVDAWERVSSYRTGESVLISGEAGIGKTRLAGELAAVVIDRGGRVTYGQCERDGVAPFEPLAAVLRDVLRTGGAPPPQLRTTLAAMLPELATTPGGTGVAPGPSVLGDAVATWLTVVATERPLVIVVDDLHWLTRTGANLLRALVARTVSGAPILLVALARTEAVEHLETVGLATAARVALTELDAEQSARLGVHLGVAPAPGSSEVMHATGGVPLLLELLAETGHGPAAAIGGRVRDLGEDAMVMLQLAALEPAEFQLGNVAAAAGIERGAAIDALDRASTARLIEEIGIGLYRFRHAVVQDTIRDSLSATRRAELHLALADATRTCSPHDLGRIAHHLDLAGPVAADDAIAALIAAASASVQRGAGHDALSFAERADRRISASHGLGGLQRRRLDSAIVRARALAQLGLPEWSTVALDAAEQADRLGEIDCLVQAVLVSQRVLNTTGLRRTDPRRVKLLDTTLARLEPADGPRRAMVLAALADALRDSSDHARLSELRNHVAALGHESVLPARERAQLLMRVSGLFDGHGATPARLSAAASLVELHLADPGDVVIRQMAAFTNVLSAAAAADGRALQHWLDVLALGVGEPEVPLAAWSVPLCASWWALAGGELGPARSFAAAARDAGRRLGLPDADAIAAAQILAVDYERGPRLPTPQQWVSTRQAAGLGEASGAYDLMLLADDRPAEAHALLDLRLAEHFADADQAPERLTALYAYVLAAAAVEHSAASEELHRLLEPSCGSMISTAISLNPSVDYACALCAVISSSWDAALVHLDAADRLHRRLGARRFIAQSALLRAELELRRPGGDVVLAGELAGDVAGFASSRQLQRLLAGASALAERAAALR